MTGRCEYALHWGITLHTRCILKPDHVKRRKTEMHEGRSLSSYPDKRIRWYPNDQREYRTDRDDHFTWVEQSP